MRPHEIEDPQTASADPCGRIFSTPTADSRHMSQEIPTTAQIPLSVELHENPIQSCCNTNLQEKGVRCVRSET